jgi:hypothetical protein
MKVKFSRYRPEKRPFEIWKIMASGFFMTSGTMKAVRS